MCLKEGAALDLRRTLKTFGMDFERALVISGGGATRRMADVIAETAGPDWCVIPAVSTAEAEVEAILDEARLGDYEVVVGVGGGKAVNVAKACGFKLGIPMVSVPTALSNDGIASPIAVISNSANGQHTSFGVGMPVAVVVDLELVRSAPAESTRAGIGDLISNISALHDGILPQNILVNVLIRLLTCCRD